MKREITITVTHGKRNCETQNMRCLLLRYDTAEEGWCGLYGDLDHPKGDPVRHKECRASDPTPESADEGGEQEAEPTGEPCDNCNPSGDACVGFCGKCDPPAASTEPPEGSASPDTTAVVFDGEHGQAVSLTPAACQENTVHDPAHCQDPAGCHFSGGRPSDDPPERKGCSCDTC